MTAHSIAESAIHVLADYRQRLILSSLVDNGGSLSLDELATALSAWKNDAPPDDVTAEDRHAVLRELHHIHLPALADAGIVSYDPETSTVAVSDHPALDEDWVADLLASPVGPTDRIRDPVLDALTDQRRRAALSILVNDSDSISASDLAAHVVAQEGANELVEVSEREHAEVLTELHHVHLPKLADAGLIDYDASEQTVTARTSPWLIAERTGRSSVRRLGNALVSADGIPAESIWILEGREDITTRVWELFEEADDELFLVLAADGHLWEEGRDRLREAVDRGVDVYVGARTDEVRELVLERVPEATAWEPRLDWLNLPSEREPFDAVVFADRKAVLLAALDGDDRHGGRATGITAEGWDVSRAVLAYGLLGPELDRLGLLSKGILEELPL